MSVASNVFNYDELVEITFDCLFKGYKGRLTYVSDVTSQIEVLIEHEEGEDRELTSYFRGFVNDIKKVVT